MKDYDELDYSSLMIKLKTDPFLPLETLEQILNYSEKINIVGQKEIYQLIATTQTNLTDSLISDMLKKAEWKIKWSSLIDLIVAIADNENVSAKTAIGIISDYNIAFDLITRASEFPDGYKDKLRKPEVIGYLADLEFKQLKFRKRFLEFLFSHDYTPPYLKAKIETLYYRP